MAKQTKAQALAAIKAVGREITVRVTDGEYRVSLNIDAIRLVKDCDYNTARERNEALASYCSDAQEALCAANVLHDYFKNTAPEAP